MSGGNNSNDGNGEGWGSKFLKVASAAAATAAVAGGLYALITSSTDTERPQVPVEAHARRVTREETTSSHVGWKKPEFGWVKLNVDGSRVHETSAACGGVLRDGSGTWLHGFAQKLDPICKVHVTEMKAILTGLRLAREMNLKKLLVESDNDSVVTMVNNGCKYNNPQFDIIREIRQLCFDDPTCEVRVVPIPRTANQVANRLAKDAHQLPDHVLRKYPSPPNNITALLLVDAQGGLRF